MYEAYDRCSEMDSPVRANRTRCLIPDTAPPAQAEAYRSAAATNWARHHRSPGVSRKAADGGQLAFTWLALGDAGRQHRVALLEEWKLQRAGRQEQGTGMAAARYPTAAASHP